MNKTLFINKETLEKACDDVGARLDLSACCLLPGELKKLVFLTTDSYKEALIKHIFGEEGE